MGENSKIEWTDHTANLWWGCAKVHTGCKNCYAEHLSEVRYKNGVWGEKAMRKPIKSALPNLRKFQRQAAESGTKSKVFIGSMMDIFENGKFLEETEGVDFVFTFQLRDMLFYDIILGKYPNLIFQLLPKRYDNILKMVPRTWLNNIPSNVWFGTSISDQETADKAIPYMKDLPFQTFLSIEPQVGPIWDIDLDGIDWVIQGGESGPKKRPFDLEWAYRMKQMCREQRTPYFFKQIDKVQEIPKDLMIREFPIFMQL